MIYSVFDNGLMASVLCHDESVCGKKSVVDYLIDYPERLLSC